MTRRLKITLVGTLAMAMAFALTITVLRASNLVTFTIVGEYGSLGATDSNLVGIDWLPTLPNQDQLLVSRNWTHGVPDVFGQVAAATGAATPWGALPTAAPVSGWQDEIYFSSVRPGQGPNWRVGDVFSAETETYDGSDPLASRVNIARFRADGTMVKEDFAVLQSETKFKRGAVRFDYAGVVNGALIVVASNDLVGPATVYTIQSTGPDDGAVGVVTKLVDIPQHLEGLTTVPNDPGTYGSLAGKILVGAEFMSPPSMVVIDPINPSAYTFMPLALADGTPIKVEDLWIVPPNSTFYGVDFPDVNPQAAIWKIDAAQWQNLGLVGQLLIAQEYNAPLYTLKWDGSAFVTTRIFDGNGTNENAPGHWEHITFVPVSQPNVTIVKDTNGADANNPNGSDVPNVSPGGTITWTYIVTNTGNVSVPKANVQVTDNTTGVTPTFNHEQTGNGDGVFDPGEVWIYSATGTALDLTLPPPAGVHTVASACTAGGTQPPRTAYTNIGTVTIPGATASDPSSYCNPPPPPPPPGVSIIKFTNGADANDPNAAGVPNIAEGSTVTWTYRVTNTGQTSVPRAQVVVTDNTLGVTPTFTSEVSGNGDTNFDPGEVWLYTATGTALDLTLPHPGVHTVANSCIAGGTQPPSTAYTNIGTVTIPGASASDPSSYCNPPPNQCLAGDIGGVDLGGIVTNNQLFLFTNGSQDANWQGAAKGYVGNVVVDGIKASERTSGSVPYAGTISTNDSTLGAWQAIVNQNAGQAFASYGQTALVSQQETKLKAAFAAINAMAVTPGYAGVSSTSLNGLNIQDNMCETVVINVTSGFQVSSKINITGDACDMFILRWDTDQNFANGYQGQVKFQSGGAIVPKGALTAGNFINVAGDIDSSGGGTNPPAPYPQGPRLNNGTGPLIAGGANFSGGGFFTGYWLTTGAPTNFDAASGLYSGNTAPLSNGIFVGGWYTITNKFSMTSGTSGVFVGPNCQ